METVSFQNLSGSEGKDNRRRAITRTFWTLSNGGTTQLDLGIFSGYWPNQPRPLITPEGLSKVFELAGTGEEPEIAWQILRDAYHAQEDGEYRRAIIDAGIAFERAVDAWLEDRLARVEAGPAKFIRDKTKRASLGRMIPTLKDLGWVAPAGIDQFVALRNDTIHNGNVPNNDQVLGHWPSLLKH